MAYAGICGCRSSEVILARFFFFFFLPNDLRPIVFECQATDSIPPQVRTYESFRPFYWLRGDQPCSLMSSREAQTSQFLRFWSDAVGDRTPVSRSPSLRCNHYATWLQYTRSELYVLYPSNVLLNGPDNYLYPPDPEFLFRLPEQWHKSLNSTKPYFTP